MELGIYDIIKGVSSTPKSISLRRTLGKLTFNVNKHANKIQVREAVEKIWGVKVDNVRMVMLHGKVKQVRRRSYSKPDLKKAIVTLKEGFSIDLPDHYESVGLHEQAAGTQGGE